jgi:hypothetical protein
MRCAAGVLVIGQRHNKPVMSETRAVRSYAKWATAGEMVGGRIVNHSLLRLFALATKQRHAADAQSVFWRARMIGGGEARSIKVQKNIKRIIVTALWAVVCVPFVSAQSINDGPHKTECKLTVAQAPELRGFRLGMTEAQVVARLPEISFEAANEVGLAKLRLSFVDPENYPGRLL